MERSSDHQRPTDLQAAIARRAMFQRLGLGMGGFALSHLLAQEAAGKQVAGRIGQTTQPARAKSVIYIHLVGAPSHLDLYDPKPVLQQRTGEPCPAHLFESGKFAFVRNQPTLLGTPSTTPYRFARCGQSGLEISNLMPHLQQVADEITLIRSMHTDEFNHGPAQLFLLTGFGRFGRPSLGSWLSYGLGSVNRNLPAFVVLITGNVLGAGSAAWGSGFLPTVHQGVEFRSQGDPVLFLSNPPGVDRSSRRQILDAVNDMNQARLADVGDPEIATRISQYEMAYRMQSSVPGLIDIASESPETLKMYGADPAKPGFANNCLLARRLVEQGVRFVQLFDQGWDTHGNVFNQLPKKVKQVDRPIAALIADLRQRGLLDETLVVWSAEFGRTPFAQADADRPTPHPGRDHHKDAYTAWVAGGGVKGGFSYGQTDELGYHIVENPVHVHDFNATLLHLMGIDHRRLTFLYQGRPYRLTDVHGHVLQDILA